MDNEQNASLFELELDDDAKIYLRQAAKWARVLAFILIGVVVVSLASLLMIGGGNLFRLGSESFAFVLILILVVGLFAAIIAILFNFANKVTIGLQDEDVQKIESGIHFLKVFFIFLGVCTLLILIFTIIKIFTQIAR